jgi:hypothetical protein
VAAGRCDESGEEREGWDRTHECQGYQAGIRRVSGVVREQIAGSV